MTLSDALSSALAVRLNLQIAVSGLPVVSEEMDSPLGRWIDSAPLPPENPDGRDVDFEVRVACDLSRVCFAMHGPPRGVIPKLGPYLRTTSFDAAQEAIIDGIGGELEPARVGSFVAIEGRGLTTGWLFPTRLSLDALARHVPGVGESPPARWAAERGVTDVAGLWQAVGDVRYCDLVLAAPGTSPDAAVGAAGELFERMAGAPLPAVVRDAALAGEPPRVMVRLGGAPRVSLVIGGAGRVALETIARSIGVEVAPPLAKVVTALGAADLSAIEYALAGGVPGLSGFIAPTGAERPPAFN